MKTDSDDAANAFPPVLYKYRSWNDYTKDFLAKGEIWLSSPSDFNDPFDCQICAKIDTASPAKLRKALMRKLKRSAPHLRQDQRERIVRKRVLKFCDHEEMRLEKEKWKNRLNENRGVYSLSATCSNLLMWAHYSQEHKGICVGLSTTKLLDVSDMIFTEHDIPGALVKVEYAEDYPIIDVLADDYESGEWMDKAVSIKSLDWKYEEEYRLIIAAESISERKCCLPVDSITEVIIGVRSDEPMKKEVLSLLREHNLNAKIFQAELADLKFGLKLRPLENV